MSSGVTVSVDAKQVYDDVKKNKHHRYIIYSIKDEKVTRGFQEGFIYNLFIVWAMLKDSEFFQLWASRG